MGHKPNIRFKEYKDEWSSQKLGSITDFETGKPFSEELSDNGAYIVMDMGSVSQEGNRIETKKTNTKRDILCKGDLIMPKDDIGGGLIIGRTAHIPMNNMYVLGDHVYRLRFENESGLFIHYQINSDFVRKQIIPLVTGSAQLGLNSKNLKGVTIGIPSFDEQAKIGKYILTLDNLLTFFQHKHDTTIKLKEYMIQNIFPKHNESKPTIRFNNFSDDWTAYKLGDLYTERNEKGNDSLQILSVSIHSGVSDGELNEEELGKAVRRSEDKSTYKHVYEGDLIFNMMRAWQGAIGVAKCEGMISPAYISAIPNEKVYPLFMDYALRRSETIAEINNLSYGIRDFRKRLYWNSFIHVNCMLPTLEEQKKIYEFLKSIDAYIDVLQKKCSELKTFKKYLLRNMFCEHT